MRPCAFLLMLFSFYTNLFSQVNTTGFSIIIPRQKISGSLYSSIQFIDSRKDTGTMGFVQQGFFNKKAAIIAKSPFQDQLENLLDSITGKSGGEGELLFQLRYLRFAEVTNALTEKGYCYIKAALYGKKDDQYVKLSLLDSIVYVKSAEVRKALLRNTSIVLTNFISDNLMNQGNDSDSISYKDIGGIEQFEKKKIPLYIAKTYKDGLYANFISFKNQVPEVQVIVEMDDKELHSVKMIDKNGHTKKVSPKNIYAIVHDGLPYIATEYGYYALRKMENDFYFFGKGKVTAKFGEVFYAGFMFGIIGGIIAADKKSIYKIKIDHLNGHFIPEKDMNLKVKKKILLTTLPRF